MPLRCSPRHQWGRVRLRWPQPHLDCVGIGYVERKHHRFAAGGLNLALRGFESFDAAGDEPNLGAMAAEFPGCSPAQARGPAGDEDDFASQFKDLP